MTEAIIGIYMIVNKINKKRYVGSSIDIYNRWSEHIRLLSSNKHHSKALQRAWNKYGEDNFEFMIIEECSRDYILYREELFMGFYDSYHEGYNCCKSASSRLGSIQSEETRMKISTSCKGRKMPPKSEETLVKMSKAQKGKKLSQETRNKISKANLGNSRAKGHTWSREQRKKYEENKEQIVEKLRKKRSEESKKKMSEAAKERCKRPEIIEQLRRNGIKTMNENWDKLHPKKS